MSDLRDGQPAASGRVDPSYPDDAVEYRAPVAESRSFWSRFWFVIPLLLLLIALPFVLRSCDRVAEVEELAAVAAARWVAPLVW